MNELSISDQFNFYMEKVKLKDLDINSVQYIEMKLCFYGACGQMLLTFRDKIGEMDHAKGVSAMQNLFDQVDKFWQEQE